MILIVNLYVTEKNNNSTDILSVHKLKLKNGIARIIKKRSMLLKEIRVYLAIPNLKII